MPLNTQAQTAFTNAINRVAPPVLREFAGLSRAISVYPNGDSLPLNTNIRIPAPSPGSVTSSYTEGANFDDGDSRPRTTIEFALTELASDQVSYTPEDMLSLQSAGLLENIMARDGEEIIRGVINQIEKHLFERVRRNTTRVIGTSGTIPFANEKITPLRDLGLAMDVNSAPKNNRRVILRPEPWNNLLLTPLARSDGSGRGGEMSNPTWRDNVGGFGVYESNPLALEPVGNPPGGSMQTAGAHAIGATTINFDGGTGFSGSAAVFPGQFIQFAADSNNVYSVKTGASRNGSFTINRPGLRVAIPDNNGINFSGYGTGTNLRTFNIGLMQEAVLLAMRPVAELLNSSPTQRIRRIQDMESGLNLAVALRETPRGLIRMECTTRFNSEVIQPEKTVLLLQ